MAMVTIQDLSLGEITLESLPRLKRLRELHFKTKPEICLELPRLTTYYMKHLDNKEDSPELRAGRLYKYILENKKPVIADDNLLAGTTTTKHIGVILYPDLLAQTIWPELETVSRRKKNPFGITREEIDELNLEIFPYWMNHTIQEVARADNGNPFCQRLMERIVFFLASKAYCISHTVPNYAAVVERGLLDIINEAQERGSSLGDTKGDREKRDFYQAVQLALSGILSYAANLSTLAKDMAQRENDPVRKEELLKMSEVCKKVPAQKPTTFREAINAIWICRVALHQENANVAMSPGRLDQVLYPLYRKDIERGMTLSEAVELVGCLWLKICDHVPLAPETSEELFGGSGSNQAVTLGGIDMEGKDAVNDLTYVMLRATELLKLRDPNVNARYHPEVNKKEYLHRLCEVNINTGATPCFHNDASAIEEFVFNKKAVSFSEMIDAINKNWEGHEKLHAMVKTSNEKFGTDSEMAKKNADWLIGFLHDTFHNKTNYRGGKYTVGYWTMTNHAGFGVLTGALPNGRMKGEPFASGITPVSGSAPILTACLNFVAHLDHKKIADGHALNLKYTPSTTTVPKFANTIFAFFKMGGLQVQFNIIDGKILEDAKKHPERYPDLFVRVSGYSAYFKDLNPHMQEEIITRAEYNLDTGEEVH